MPEPEHRALLGSALGRACESMCDREAAGSRRGRYVDVHDYDGTGSRFPSTVDRYRLTSGLVRFERVLEYRVAQSATDMATHGDDLGFTGRGASHHCARECDAQLPAQLICESFM
ncbi:hypothetical protein GCM10027056_28200 [Glaciibacter psychrotolerans]